MRKVIVAIDTASQNKNEYYLKPDGTLTVIRASAEVFAHGDAADRRLLEWYSGERVAEMAAVGFTRVELRDAE